MDYDMSHDSPLGKFVGIATSLLTFSYGTEVMLDFNLVTEIVGTGAGAGAAGMFAFIIGAFALGDEFNLTERFLGEEVCN